MREFKDARKILLGEFHFTCVQLIRFELSTSRHHSTRHIAFLWNGHKKQLSFRPGQTRVHAYTRTHIRQNRQILCMRTRF